MLTCETSRSLDNKDFWLVIASFGKRVKNALFWLQSLLSSKLFKKAKFSFGAFSRFISSILVNQMLLLLSWELLIEDPKELLMFVAKLLFTDKLSDKGDILISHLVALADERVEFILFSKIKLVYASCELFVEVRSDKCNLLNLAL